jgi:2-desacetyl-2-hydroxyethyl bacteriochlorophyllide A dehydrogenase
VSVSSHPHLANEPPLALWHEAPGVSHWRAVTVAPPAEGEVTVRATVSGISRGTESLVFQGLVPESERQRMRCPFQDGDFPFPVKYGYAMVGVVEAGALAPGTRVFCLHPHQSRFTVPVASVVPIPNDVPDARAVLAPQIETALNATWDGAPRIGDRIAVVGGGVIGSLVAYLCARIPGTSVTLIDPEPKRADLAEALGVGFKRPDAAPAGGCDLVFHASGTAAGLNLAIGLAGFEAAIVELSWFGAKPVTLDLGGAFHSQRLTLRASQVGHVAPERRARRSLSERLALALALAADPRLDALVGEATAAALIPARLGIILGVPGALCHLIRY